MLTNKQLDEMTPEQHHAWLAGLSEEDSMVVHTSLGHRYEIAFASYIKRILVTQEMTAGDRLDLLEGLNRLLDQRSNKEVLAAIKPVCASGAAMIEECMKLNKSGPPYRGFDLLGSLEVFDRLRQLNPSQLEAIRLLVPITARSRVT